MAPSTWRSRHVEVSNADVATPTWRLRSAAVDVVTSKWPLRYWRYKKCSTIGTVVATSVLSWLLCCVCVLCCVLCIVLFCVVCVLFCVTEGSIKVFRSNSVFRSNMLLLLGNPRRHGCGNKVTRSFLGDTGSKLSDNFPDEHMVSG